MHSDSQIPAAGELGQFKIVNGPSKFDLMAALFMGPWSSSAWVTFEVSCSTSSGVRPLDLRSLISMVRGKNVAEELWVLEGKLSASPDEPEGWRAAETLALYSSKTRKGHVEIRPKKD